MSGDISRQHSGSVLAGEALLLGFTTLVLYWLTSTTVFPATGDGYSELQHAVAATEVRTNHLLLTPLFHAVHGLLSGLGFAVSMTRVIVITNAVSGALGVAVWALMGRMAGLRRGVVLLGGLILIVSSVWWWYSRETESAMVSQLFFMLSTGFALMAQVREKLARTLCITASSISFGIAGLLSLNLVVFVPFLLLLLPRSLGIRSWLRDAVLWGSVAALIAVPWFVAAYLQSGLSQEISFIGWLAYHPTAEMTGSIERGISPLAVMRAGVGLARCLFPMWGGAPTALKMLLTGQGAASLAVLDVVLFALAALLSAVLFVGSLWLGWRERRGVGLWMAIVLAIGVAVVVNTNWLGSDPQFWLPIYPFMLLSTTFLLQELGSGGQSVARRLIPAGAVALAAVLLVVNHTWPVPTELSRAGGREWNIAREAAAGFEQETLFLALDSPESFYVMYHQPSLERLSLLHDVQGRGAEYRRRLSTRIAEAHARNRAVVAEGLSSAPDLFVANVWENMVKIHGFDQKGLSNLLEEDFAISDPGTTPDYPLVRIDRRPDRGSERE
jgi:hypothetical protein